MTIEAATLLLNGLKVGARIKVRHNNHTLVRFEGAEAVWLPYGSKNETTSRRVAVALLDEWAGRLSKVEELVQTSRLRLAQKKLTAQQAYIASLAERRVYLVHELQDIDAALELAAPVLVDLRIEAAGATK